MYVVSGERRGIAQLYERSRGPSRTPSRPSPPAASVSLWGSIAVTGRPTSVPSGEFSATMRA